MDTSVTTIGCVSFLNARPLVWGLEAAAGIRIVEEVPSRLLDGLLAGRTDIALCPVIDYQTANRELCVVPVGAIGSNGETLTVRLFADKPLPEVTAIAVDGDSRTSVALLRIVLHDLYGIAPRLRTLPSGTPPPRMPRDVDAILLIGDKVVASAPSLPYQLDLGEAWKRLTGQPFVFAVWMALGSADLGALPGMLRSRRDANRHWVDEIVAAHAEDAGWPVDLARHYLGTLLRYDVGQRELKAITTFWTKCRDLGLVANLKPLRLYRGAPAAKVRPAMPCRITESGGPIGRG